MQKLRKDYKDVADTLARTQQNITSALKSYRSAVDSLEQRIRKDKRV
jgi:DNA anti-recombination protein RmuC